MQPLLETQGKLCLYASAPSLETSVCDRETRRFNSEAANLDKDVHIFDISNDLLNTQARWCGADGWAVYYRFQIAGIRTLVLNVALDQGEAAPQAGGLRRGSSRPRNLRRHHASLGDEPGYKGTLQAIRHALYTIKGKA
jgi:hypothetical protein